MKATEPEQAAQMIEQESGSSLEGYILLWVLPDARCTNATETHWKKCALAHQVAHLTGGSRPVALVCRSGLGNGMDCWVMGWTVG